MIEYTIIALAAYFWGSLQISSQMAGFASDDKPKLQSFLRTFSNLAKGYIIVCIAHRISHSAAEFATFFVFIGHMYPAQRSFKGGNGLAVLLGALTALIPMLGLIAICSWLFTFFVYRYQALSAILSALTTPTIALMIGLDLHVCVALSIPPLIFWRHRIGLARMAQGTEKMVSWDR